MMSHNITQRLTKLPHSSEFKRIMRCGQKFTYPSFIIFRIFPQQSQLESAHGSSFSIPVGIIASKKVGNAVARNRCKRLLRAAIREVLPSIKREMSIVLVARAELLRTRFDILVELLHTSVQR